MKRCATFVIPLVLGVSLGAQVYPGQTRAPRSGSGRGDSIGSAPEGVASFDGVFKFADKKYVEIQVESGDTMRMYLTHSTKFIRDGKAVKVSEFHDGDKVVADATRDARLNLLAVRIELKPKSEK